MSEFLKLAERCEAAGESSFYLDKEILAAFGFTWRGMDYWSRDNAMWRKKVHFTSSIDAAIDLVPEGMDWRVDTMTGLPGAIVCVPNAWLSHKTAPRMVHGATPALALCAAALRAQAEHPVSGPGESGNGS